MSRSASPASRLAHLIRAGARRNEAPVIAWTGALAVSALLFALATARWLGTSERGVIVVFLTTSSFLMLVGSFGVGTGGRVLLHRAAPLGVSTYLRHARTLSVIHVATSATLGVVVLAMSGGLPHPWVGGLFVMYAVLLLAAYLLRELLHGVGRHGEAVFGDVLPALIQTAAVVVAHSLGRLTLLSTTVILVCGVGFQCLYLLSRIRQVERPEGDPIWTFRRLLNFSIPAMFAALGQAFVIRGDRLILGALAGTSAVGVYGAAATLTEVLWIIPGAVAQVAFRRASVSSSGTQGRRVRQLTLLLTVLLAAVLALVAPLLVDTLLGPAYGEAKQLVLVLTVAAIPMASYQLDVAVLNGLGRLRQAGAITVIGSVVLCIACALLVPTWGMHGAAWASFVAYSAMAAGCKVDLRRAQRDGASPAQLPNLTAQEENA